MNEQTNEGQAVAKKQSTS